MPDSNAAPRSTGRLETRMASTAKTVRTKRAVIALIVLGLAIIGLALTRGLGNVWPIADWDWTAGGTLALALAASVLVLEGRAARLQSANDQTTREKHSDLDRQLEAIPYLRLEPPRSLPTGDGRWFTRFTVTNIGTVAAVAIKLHFRGMHDRHTPQPQEREASVELPVLGPGEGQDLHQELADFRAPGGPRSFAQDWIEVRAEYRGPLGSVGSLAYAWCATDREDPLGAPGLGERWSFLELRAVAGDGSVLLSVKDPVYEEAGRS